MSRHRRNNRNLPQETPKEYSIQTTPFVLRDIGWKIIKIIAESAYPTFAHTDFRPLIVSKNGTTMCEGLGPEQTVKVFIVPSLAGIENCFPDRPLMVVPYRDKEGIKVLYFKWVAETLYDSFSVPDGQNRVWKNEEEQP